MAEDAMKMNTHNLREFLTVTCWWPLVSFRGDQDRFKDDSNGRNYRVPCADNEKDIRLRQIRNSLTTAMFEIVDAGANSGTPDGSSITGIIYRNSNQPAVYQGRRRHESVDLEAEPAAQQCSNKETSLGNISQEPLHRTNASFSDSGSIPPCFAIFTRFNCNVTLVSQRVFGERCSVEVLGSRRGTVDSSLLGILKIYAPWFSPLSEFYARHVVLKFPSMRGTSAISKGGCFFSYGAIFMDIEALPPQMRVHVIEEKLPFGAILDRLGLQRSVNVGMQLHIHLNEEFFLACSNSSINPTICDASSTILEAYVTQEASRTTLRERNLADDPSRSSCTCRLLLDKEHCTFGRVTTICIEGRPSAFVLEIINAHSVLKNLLSTPPEELLEKHGEKECRHSHWRQNTVMQEDSCKHAFGGGDNLMRSECSTQTGVERLLFLDRRCLCSVYRCPVHRGELPPITELTRNLRSSIDSVGCKLCRSVSCSTNFETAKTDDMI